MKKFRRVAEVVYENEKIKGSSTEPCGTPHLTIFISVLKSLYEINRFLFDK